MERPAPLECVANVSEGRDQRILRELADACRDALIDLHADLDHHRSVFTLAGPPDLVQEAARALARVAVEKLDLSRHHGAHPRFGVLDVVPFVPLSGPETAVGPSRGQPDLGPAIAARDAFASWAGRMLGLPCFLYGPLRDGCVRTLPEVRRGAFSTLEPDTGPRAPHPTAGAVAVGARPVLVAYNIWIDGSDLDVARKLAASLRGPLVRALGFSLRGGVQVSCNLLDPVAVGPAEVYDRVAALLREAGPGATAGGVIRRAELVGLIPAASVQRIPPGRWDELDLSPDRTIEARLEARTGTSR
ncbi:MAG: glutamate formimidoyltransferase [Acidimicrobiales bacterium]